MAQVKYKGKVIADISKGQKLTLRVDGHELEGDIVIDGFNGGGSSGGSSECSGNHIIEVDELPTENVDETALYKMGESYYKAGGKALKDVLVLQDGAPISLVGVYEAQFNAKFELYYADNVEDIPEADRKMPDESTLVFPLYYDAYTNDVVVWVGAWASLAETLLEGMTSGGAITDLNGVATEGVYYALIGDDWKKYGILDGKTVIEVSELPTTGIDENAVYTIKGAGVCYAELGLPPLPVVVGLDYYHVLLDLLGDGKRLRLQITDIPYNQVSARVTGEWYYCYPGDSEWVYADTYVDPQITSNELATVASITKFANYDILTFKGGAFSRSYYEYKNETWIDVTKAFEGVGMADSPLPIEINTESKMNTALTKAEVGSVVKYTGTTGTYESGGLYIVEAVS